MSAQAYVRVEESPLEQRIEINRVNFAVVPREDGTYDVEASDGGPPELLISFWTKAEAEAWIAKLKGRIH